MSVQVLNKCSVEVKPVPLVSDGQGRSYDLSPLALDIGNWEVQLSTGDTSKKIYINVCRSLVQMGGPYLCISLVISSYSSVSPVCFTSCGRLMGMSVQCSSLYEGWR